MLSAVWLTSLSVILQGPSLWLPVASFHVFLWLSNSPLYAHTRAFSELEWGGGVFLLALCVGCCK